MVLNLTETSVCKPLSVPFYLVRWLLFYIPLEQFLLTLFFVLLFTIEKTSKDIQSCSGVRLNERMPTFECIDEFGWLLADPLLIAVLSTPQVGPEVHRSDVRAELHLTQNRGLIHAKRHVPAHA